jgi:hypothetical protein
VSFAALLVTVGWLWGHVAALDAELDRARSSERAMKSNAEAGEQRILEIGERSKRWESALGQQRGEIERLRESFRREPALLRARMVAPTVRLELPSSVGSGRRVIPSGSESASPVRFRP